MLYYARIDVSEGIDVNQTSASKECDICHYCYFLSYSFKFQPNVWNRCHDLLMVSMKVLIRPKKVVLFPETGRLKNFLSLNHSHSCACIRIYICCFKQKNTHREKQKAKETKESKKNKRNQIRKRERKCCCC